MTTSTKAVNHEPAAKGVGFAGDFLCLYLSDGREIRVPLEFYPRLKKATAKQRENYKIIGMGSGIHWPAINEDLSVEGIIAGRPSRF